MSEGEVLYLTEREAYAIRANAFGYRDINYDVSRMEYVFGRGEQAVCIPENIVARFMDDWRQSGLWSLKGRPTADAIERNQHGGGDVHNLAATASHSDDTGDLAIGHRCDT